MYKALVFVLCSLPMPAAFSAESSGQSTPEQRIRHLFVLLESEKLDELGAMVAEDFEFYDPTAGVRLSGRAQSLDYLRLVFAQQSGIRVKLTKLEPLGDRVVWVTGVWTGQFQGKRFSAPFLSAFVLNEQLEIQSQVDHFDLADLTASK
ncbi:MAG: nuclear transport factor 2 family protein [Pseudomonadota bacterium]